MKPFLICLLAVFWPVLAGAQSRAADVDMAGLMYHKRPVVVFADTPDDPKFIAQMAALVGDTAALEARDVIVITNTDPQAKTTWRQKLRPRGFSFVLMDKDLSAVIRKPLPWSLREIIAAIDKFPLRRQELLNTFRISK